MPDKVLLGYAEREAIVEHRLQILGFGIVLVLSRRGKESRRRHLFWVADYYRALCAGKRGNSFTGRHLRRFVENDDIEQPRLRGEVLGYGYRAHKHTGRDDA